MNEQAPFGEADILRNKIDDLRANARLIINQFLEKTITNPLDIMQRAERLGNLETDAAWVSALNSMGFNDETISRIWDVKDEKVRETKANPNIS